MPAQWDNIEAALYTWLASATGLPVIWGYQSAEQPAGDYCELRIEAINALGDDYVWTNYSAARDAGSEVELQVVGDREVSVMVQAYTAAIYGAASARQLLQRAQMRLWLPSQDTAFDAVAISIFDVQPLQDVPVVLETDFQGRASFRLRFYVRDSLSEFTTWIEHVTPPTGTFNQG